jgi:hypothetical protein
MVVLAAARYRSSGLTLTPQRMKVPAGSVRLGPGSYRRQDFIGWQCIAHSPTRHERELRGQWPDRTAEYRMDHAPGTDFVETDLLRSPDREQAAVRAERNRRRAGHR